MQESPGTVPNPEFTRRLLHREAGITDRKAALAQFVEKRIFAANPAVTGEEGVGQEFTTLSAREKADLLYGKLTAYLDTVQLIRQEREKDLTLEPEPVNPRLVGEMRALWEDTTAKDLFLSRFAESRVDTSLFRVSELGRSWQQVNKEIVRLEETYRVLSRKLFLQEVIRPDQVSVTKSEIAKAAQEVTILRSQREKLVTLEGFPAVAENTDAVAQIAYEQFTEYARQAQESGFVWLPSRVDLYHRTVEALQNGRWPFLVGEAGTGKSELADAAAVALTGEQPTHLACSSRTSERDLISFQDIDSATGGGFEQYGPLMQAATGYQDSRRETPTFQRGRIMRADESGRLGDQGYARFKEARQLRSATPREVEAWKKGTSLPTSKQLNGKPILPGFACIWTTNPVGPRYPDRSEPDAAMRRELATITVDYPPMTQEEPELYEFMVATLMDENRHITAAKEELTSAYTKVEIPPDQQEVLSDGTRIVGKYEIVTDPTNTQHGILYRLSFALRALQDAFNYGNMVEIPQQALRFTTGTDGAIQITSQGGDLLTLSSSTVTLGEVGSWMKGFNERFTKDNPKFHTSNLTDYLKLKLETYLAQADIDDRPKIKALFDYFHLFDPPPDLSSSQPITPKEIGYLSPRVPRPVEVVRREPKQKESQPPTTTGKPELYDDIRVMLENGSTVLVKPEPLIFEHQGKKRKLKHGSKFTMGENRLQYVGYAPDGKVVASIYTGRRDEALHKFFDPKEIQEKGDFTDWALELAKQQLGENNVLDEQVIHKMVEKLRAQGINVEFEIPDVEMPLEYLENLKVDDQNKRTRLLVLRPEWMLVDGVRKEITINNLKNMLQGKNPFGTGDIFNPDEWSIDFLRYGPFVSVQLLAGYANPTKEVIPESLNKKWPEQEELLKTVGGIRREAAETVWDMLLYYANTGEWLLTQSFDWTKTMSHIDPYYIAVGKEKGIRIYSIPPRWNSIHQKYNLGVCPQKTTK